MQDACDAVPRFKRTEIESAPRVVLRLSLRLEKQGTSKLRWTNPYLDSQGQLRDLVLPMFDWIGFPDFERCYVPGFLAIGRLLHAQPTDSES